MAPGGPAVRPLGVLTAPTGAHIAFLAALVTPCEGPGMLPAAAPIPLSPWLATFALPARAGWDGPGGARGAGIE